MPKPLAVILAVLITVVALIALGLLLFQWIDQIVIILGLIVVMALTSAAINFFYNLLRGK